MVMICNLHLEYCFSPLSSDLIERNGREYFGFFHFMASSIDLPFLAGTCQLCTKGFFGIENETYFFCYYYFKKAPLETIKKRS